MTPINFAYWDTQNIFTQHQAAWLWDGMHDPPEERPQYQAISPPMSAIGEMIRGQLQAVVQSRIDSASKDEPGGALLQWAKRFTREELREYAINLGDYRPLFLFPENRLGAANTPQKLPSKAIQPVYQIIAALWVMYYGEAPTPDDLERLITDFETETHDRNLPIPKDSRTIASHLKKAFNLV